MLRLSGLGPKSLSMKIPNSLEKQQQQVEWLLIKFINISDLRLIPSFTLMKVMWCQRCKRKQRRSMMVATPHVSPAIRQLETWTVLETVGLAKQVRSCLTTPLLSRPPGTAIGKLWICLMWVTDKEMLRLQINIARFCRQSWMLIYVGGEFYTLWPDPGVRGEVELAPVNPSNPSCSASQISTAWPTNWFDRFVWVNSSRYKWHYNEIEDMAEVRVQGKTEAELTIH